MEQIGNQVRLVDEDGSIYLGEIQTIAPPDAPAVGMSLRAKKAEEKTDPSLATYAATASVLNSSESNQLLARRSSFNIRAEGTNRSLNQSVVFHGNYNSAPASLPPAPGAIAAQTSPVPKVQTVAAPPPPSGISQAARSPQSSARPSGEPEVGILQGQALIGGTNLLDIHAVQKGTPSKP